MEDINRESNQVEVKGTISGEPVFSHRVFGECFYTADLLVDRHSALQDRIPLMISERLMDMDRNYAGDFVGVKGQFRSHNRHMDENTKKNRLELRVFAKEVRELDGSREEPQDDIFLDGHLCKPVVFRKTPNGREIADILVAVNRAYGKSDYIPCICWGRTARYVSFMNVGDHVLLWGRIQSRDYFKKGDAGHKRTAFEVSVSRLERIRENVKQHTLP